MPNMILEHQLANGYWAIVPNDRFEEFIAAAMEFSTLDADGIRPRRYTWDGKTEEGPAERQDVLDALASGIHLRTDRADWYSWVRQAVYARRRVETRVFTVSHNPTQPVCSTCKSAIAEIEGVFGPLCPSCYDRQAY